MNTRISHYLKLLFLSGFTLFTYLLFAQTVYKFSGTSSGPGGASGSGHTTASQTVTFYKNGSTASSYTATFSLSNQQFNSAEGLGSIAGLSFGADGNFNSNSSLSSVDRYRTIGASGSPAAADFTASESSTSGSGIATTDGAISVFALADALINSSRNSSYSLGTSVKYATLTIAFNKPISNPVIHLGGFGGAFFIDYDQRPGTNDNMSVTGFALDYRLTSGGTLVKKSGSDNFAVSGNRAYDNATWLGANRNGSCVVGTPRMGAAGSVMVQGTGLTSVSFDVYLTSDAGMNVQYPTGENSSYNNGNCDPAASAPFGNTGSVFPSWAGVETVVGDAATIAISFNTVNVTGTVFNDKDAGNVDNGSGGSTQADGVVPSGIYANLVDAQGKVVESVPVATNGTYTLTTAQSGVEYTVQLSSSQLGEGTDAPSSFTPPTDWENTGSFVGAPGSGNSGILTGTSTKFTPGTDGIGDVNFGIRDVTALAVNFGYLKAVFKDGQLAVDFQTLSEQNTDRFEIEASKDGISFQKIGEVNSKSGDSDSPQTYRFTVTAGNAVAVLGISLAGLGLLGFGFRPTKSRLVFIAAMMCVGISIAVLSCAKQDGGNVNYDGNLFIRVVEIDKNNNKEFSQPVKVVRDK